MPVGPCQSVGPRLLQPVDPAGKPQDDQQGIEALRRLEFIQDHARFASDVVCESRYAPPDRLPPGLGDPEASVLQSYHACVDALAQRAHTKRLNELFTLAALMYVTALLFLLQEGLKPSSASRGTAFAGYAMVFLSLGYFLHMKGRGALRWIPLLHDRLHRLQGPRWLREGSGNHRKHIDLIEPLPRAFA